MKKSKIISIVVLSAIFGLVGCSTEVIDNPIAITAGIAKMGKTLNDSDKVYQVGDTIVYKFEVTSPNGISKVEFSSYSGVGINETAPVILSKEERITGTVWTYVDTITGIQDDVRYSIYVQDLNKQYKTKKLNAYLDISRYIKYLPMYDGMVNGTSLSFINVESGRTFYIANTIPDPSSIDFGFTFLETQPTLLACLVSFDEYWKTGTYAMVANNLSGGVTFKKSTPATTTIGIRERVKKASDLKLAYDAATTYPSTPLFSDGKVALKLAVKDVVAFKTKDGRYGLIQLTTVDAKSNSALNNQLVRFHLIVEKKLPIVN